MPDEHIPSEPHGQRPENPCKIAYADRQDAERSGESAEEHRTSAEAARNGAEQIRQLAEEAREVRASTVRRSKPSG